MEGEKGKVQIAEAMRSLRETPPSALGGRPVLAVRDYLAGVRRSADGKISPTNLGRSNVLYFELADEGWCCVRPSGTEPKIKFYFGVKEKSREDARRALENLKNAFLAPLKHRD